MTQEQTSGVDIHSRHIEAIAKTDGFPIESVRATVHLLQDGATVPFIARYRKEITGGFDEVAVTRIRDRLRQLSQLEERRATIIKQLHAHGHWTSTIEAQLRAAETVSGLEDIYLPYRPKRKTRGTKATEAGLLPLAEQLWEQAGIDPEKAAMDFHL